MPQRGLQDGGKVAGRGDAGVPARDQPRPRQRRRQQAEQGEIQRPRGTAAPETRRRFARHSTETSVFRVGLTARDAMMPASYSRIIGTASSICDTTSGGVITAASTKMPTIA